MPFHIGFLPVFIFSNIMLHKRATSTVATTTCNAMGVSDLSDHAGVIIIIYIFLLRRLVD